MSHLRQHTSKQNTKKIILLLVGFAVLAVLFVQIGLPSLINATVFLNSIGSKEQPEEQTQKDDSFFGTLYVDDLPMATNSAEIFVSGEATDFDTVEFFINNTSVEKVDLKKDAFNNKIGKLKVGENTIYLKARTDKGNHTKKSEIFSVIYKNEKPKLEISTPKDNETKSKQEITVEGKTDPGVTVTINHQPVVVDVQGSFKKIIRLKEGENKLEIIAEDDAGNTETTQMTVRYQKDE